MSDTTKNNSEIVCQRHPGCCVWYQDLFPSLSLPQGLVCRAGDQTRQVGTSVKGHWNPYVLTYDRQYRRSTLASNEINIPTTIVGRYTYSPDDIQNSTNILTCQSGPSTANHLSSPCSVLLRTDLFNIKYRHYDGSKVVFRRPQQHCARMKFKCENRIDQNRQQQPTPSDISSRYRPVHPLFYRNISSQMWRNTDKNDDHSNMLSKRLI